MEGGGQMSRAKDIWDLKMDQLNTLVKAKAGKVTILDNWRDDHQICVSIVAQPKGGELKRTGYKEN